MAYEEQYLYFNALRVRDGEEISKILEWGFNHGVDHEHLANLVEELEDNFNKYKSDKYISDDGGYEFIHAKGLEALWQLIPKLGDTKPAQYLVWSLPTSGIMFDNKIIENVMKSLPKNLVIDLKERKITRVVKQNKRETIKSFALISIFVFGLICGFLDIKGWGIFACIAIPSIVWITQSINQSLNDVIDNIVKKIKKGLEPLDEIT